jgi:predicted PurR-regulated permease PerM
VNSEHKSSHFLIKTLYYALVTAVIAGVLYCVYLFAVPFIASILCVFILGPVVNYFEVKGMKRLQIIIVIYALIAVSLTGAVFFLGPPLARQMRTIISDLPEYAEIITNTVSGIQTFAEKKFPQAAIPDLNQILRSRMPSKGGLNVDSVIAWSSSLFSVLSVIFLVPVVTFFLLADGHMVEKLLLSMVPNRYFEMVFMLFDKITGAVKLFLRGQFIDAGAVGVLTTIGLTAIGLPYAIVIGLVAGFGNLIPYLGPIIGFVPAFFVIIATGSFSVFMLIKVIAVFVLVQTVEGIFIYPIAVGKSVNLHPLVVIVGVTVGGQIAGIPGMLFAIPVISVLKVSVEVLYSGLKSYSII